MSDAPVTLKRSQHVATLTLSRPKALNALDPDTVRLLADHLEELKDDTATRVVVLTGTGRAFCAGGDLRAIATASGAAMDESLHHLAGLFHRGVRLLEQLPKPVVAAVNGVAAGGGLSLALACDLRVCAASAFFQQAYVANGLCIDGGGTYHLPRLLGLAKSLELAFLDPRISAEEAKRLGLVSEVYPDEDFAAEVEALAAKLATRPVGAMAKAKELLRTAWQVDLETRLTQEQHGIAEQAAGPEGQEGIAAFLEKRKPDYLKA